MQATPTRSQTKTLSFYKENKLWYADLPDFLALGLGTKANLLMVDGADTFLDLLSNNGTRVTVKLSTQPFENPSIHLEKIKLGLNQELLSEYVEWITNRRLQTLGLTAIYKSGSNPLPWTQKWISGGEIQVAPQETQITSYIVGGIKKDFTTEALQGMSL